MIDDYCLFIVDFWSGKIYVRAVISMMVLCKNNAIIEYNRRKSELPSVPLDVEHGQDQDHDQDQLPSVPLNIKYGI